MTKMTGENLKKLLWQSLHDVKSGAITTAQGDSIARHAREIVRVQMCQAATIENLAIVTPEMADFAKSNEE